jgi:hypothetical protein
MTKINNMRKRDLGSIDKFKIFNILSDSEGKAEIQGNVNYK